MTSSGLSVSLRTQQASIARSATELVPRLRYTYATWSLAARPRHEPPKEHPVRLQLVIGDDRAEASLHNLERLENRPLC